MKDRDEKMYREFVYTKQFDRAWEALGLNDDDQRDLEFRLLNDPKIGSVIHIQPVQEN